MAPARASNTLARHAARRLWGDVALRWGGVGLAVGAAVGTALVAASRGWFGQWGLRFSDFSWIVPLVVPASAGLIAGVLASLTRWVGAMTGAGVVDERLRLQSRVRTALELDAAGARDACAQLAIEDAERVASTVSARSAVPMRFGRGWPVALLIAGVGAALWRWLPAREWSGGMAGANSERAAAKPDEVRAVVERARDALEQIDDPRSSDHARALAEVEKELRAVRDAAPGEAGAAASRAVRQAARAIEREALAQRDASESLLKELSRAAAKAAKESEARDAVGQFADAISRLDAENAASAAEALQEQIESMTPGQRERLESQLRELAAAIERWEREKSQIADQDRIARDDASMEPSPDGERSSGGASRSAPSDSNGPRSLPREESGRSPTSEQEDASPPEADASPQRERGSASAESSAPDNPRQQSMRQDQSDTRGEHKTREPGRADQIPTHEHSDEPAGSDESARETGTPSGRRDQSKDSSREHPRREQNPGEPPSRTDAKPQPGQPGTPDMQNEYQRNQNPPRQQQSSQQSRQQPDTTQNQPVQGPQQREQRQVQGEQRQSSSADDGQQQPTPGRDESGREGGPVPMSQPGSSPAQSQDPGATAMEPKEAKSASSGGGEQSRPGASGGTQRGERTGAQTQPGATVQEQPGASDSTTDPTGQTQHNRGGRGADPGDGEKQDGSHQSTRDTLERLARTLRESRTARERAAQMLEESRELQERAQRMLEQASPREREQLERLAQELGRDRRGPTLLPRDEQARLDPPAATEPVDARGRDRDDRPRVIGEVMRDRALTDGASGVDPDLANSVRDAVASAERGIESQQVPARHSDLVRRVFDRYQRRFSPTDRPSQAEPQSVPDAPDVRPR